MWVGGGMGAGCWWHPFSNDRSVEVGLRNSESIPSPPVLVSVTAPCFFHSPLFYLLMFCLFLQICHIRDLRCMRSAGIIVSRSFFALFGLRCLLASVPICGILGKLLVPLHRISLNGSFLYDGIVHVPRRCLSLQGVSA